LSRSRLLAAVARAGVDFLAHPSISLNPRFHTEPGAGPGAVTYLIAHRRLSSASTEPNRERRRVLGSRAGNPAVRRTGALAIEFGYGETSTGGGSGPTGLGIRQMSVHGEYPASPGLHRNKSSPRQLDLRSKGSAMPTSEIDQVLGAATECGDVPGVVAMAATRDATVYQGAFGRRALPDGAAMTRLR
jgi:hypothetical protein